MNKISKILINQDGQLKEYTLDMDLSEYIKTSEADDKYMPKSGSTTGGSSEGASLSISLTGSFNNYGNNGQAFNAIRNLTDTKYQGVTGSGFKLNAASFGVKDNGTTAFTHKKYDTFNKDTGAYTGARNTAVLVFSGRSGLLYAKNTGSAADVTEDMYKYVGVIDSPDTTLKVYSSAQADGITNALALRITDLEGLNEYLMSVVSLLINKVGITEEELSEVLSDGLVAQLSLTDINDDIQSGINNNTVDYSEFSNEESTEIV